MGSTTKSVVPGNLLCFSCHPGILSLRFRVYEGGDLMNYREAVEDIFDNKHFPAAQSWSFHSGEYVVEVVLIQQVSRIVEIEHCRNPGNNQLENR
jgi:hypothetical protein